MFTWICPRCGREVPPSATECLDCVTRDQTGPAQPREAPSSPSSSFAETASRFPQPSASSATGPPAWLLAFVFAIIFVSMGTLGFLAYRYFSHKGEPLIADPVSPIRTPQTASAASATPTANVLNKYVEVTGLRLLEDNPKNLQVQFVIVNHSPAPLIDLAGSVTIRPTTAPPNGEAVGTFGFRLPELRPYESKDMKAPLQSKLRVYELPDWQFIRADVTITSPQANP
jgi:hypothetical protein